MRNLICLSIVILLISSIAGAAPVIVPQPKDMILEGGVVSIGETVKIHDFSSGDAGIQASIDSVLKQYGCTRADNGFHIYLGTMDNTEAVKLAGSCGLDVPEHKEGYALAVQPENIIIIGRTDQGLFYGIQTLRQLMEMKPGTVELPQVKISDQPALDFRALHCYTGKGALVEQLQLVDFMAEHKYNALIISLEHMEFKSQPGIYDPAMTQPQAEIQKIIEHARSNYIEVIPLLPTLSHMRWLFFNNQNMDFVEDPETPEAYNVLAPRTYEVIFGLFDEIMDLFEPKSFHIGHDEVTMFGRYPYQESTKAYSVTELVHMDLDKLFSYFDGKGVGLCVWSDMFLADGLYTDADNAENPRIARLRRKNLMQVWKKYDVPKLTVYDWHYASAEPEEFTSLETWKKDGFPVVASTWYGPENIRNFTLKAIRENIDGLCQTTWAGFNFYMEENVECHDQFAAYILAADYSWSGREEMVEELPYDYRQRFWNTWYGMKYGTDSRELKVDDLSLEVVKRIMTANRSSRLTEQKLNATGNLKTTFKHFMANPLDKPLRFNYGYGEIDGAGEIDVTLAPGEEKTIIDTFPAKVSNHQTKVKLELPLKIFLPENREIEFVTEAHLSNHWDIFTRENRIKIDGSLDDWSGMPSYIFNDREYIDIKKEWTPEDLSAKAFFCYDDKYLYFGFDVTDDTHHNQESPIAFMWQGDSLQVVIDYMNNKTEDFDADDLEFGFGIINGQCRGYLYHPQGEAGSKIEKKIKYAAKREGTHTYYEVMIPIDARIPRSEIGSQLGFSFGVNDNDGEGFNGGLVATEGIYHQKDPFMYGILELK